MGQVFTWDSIQAGKIPEKRSFHRVAFDMRTSLAGEPAIVTALLFGSVVRGDFDIRSDVDCVVIYKKEQEAWAVSMMHDIDRRAHALHVPVNFTPCDTVIVATRFHALGSAFVRHLRSAMDAGGLIKGNLVDILAPTIPAEQEIESYIRMKMYNLQESLVQITSFSEERRVAFFKKALEAPTHVARKMLIYEDTLRDGDSKREVQERYRDTMPGLLSKQFDYLLKVDRQYSADLEGQMEKPNQSRYEKALDRLQGRLPDVLEFLRSNIIRLNKSR